MPADLRDELRRVAREIGERESVVIRNLIRVGLQQQQEQHAPASR